MTSRARSNLTSNVLAGPPVTVAAADERAKASPTSKRVPRASKRTRASRACMRCRVRKVRCNVVEELPCTNCRWDEVHCDQQGLRKNAAQRSEITSKTLGQHVENDSGSRPHGAIHSPRINLSLQYFGFVNHAATLKDSEESLFIHVSEEVGTPQPLPIFLKPLPPSLAAEDANYLHAKGALTIPNISLRNALIDAFVNYVYPFTPVVNLHEFLGILGGHDAANGQVSLLLFQAAMFSAVAFVEMEALHEAGFRTRKDARKAFFLKSRLLYDFDYDSDPLTHIQALLLMSYWHEGSDDQKDASHWIGAAISLAYTISWHPFSGNTQKAERPGDGSLQSPSLWRRIWWSCFMRDRLISLGMRRPMRINGDFNLPMLKESDFEIRALPRLDTARPGLFSLLHSLETQRELALLCISKVKLCICIGHTLTVQYSVISRANVCCTDTTNSTMLLSPNRISNAQNIEAIDQEIQVWEASLPECCEYRPLSALDAGGGKRAITIHRTLLHMLRCATISALHRPSFLPGPLKDHPTPRSRVFDAATRITEMAMGLNQLSLARFLPTYAIMSILPTMIVHLMDVKSPVQRVRERAAHGFHQCMLVMQQLQEIYDVADFAMEVLDAAKKKTPLNAKMVIDKHQLKMAGNELQDSNSATDRGFFTNNNPPESRVVSRSRDSTVAPVLQTAVTLLSPFSSEKHPDGRKSRQESNELPSSMYMGYPMLENTDGDLLAELYFDYASWNC